MQPPEGVKCLGLGPGLCQTHTAFYTVEGEGDISLASRKMEKGGTNEGQVTELMLVSKKQFNLFV